MLHNINLDPIFKEIMASAILKSFNIKKCFKLIFFWPCFLNVEWVCALCFLPYTLWNCELNMRSWAFEVTKCDEIFSTINQVGPQSVSSIQTPDVGDSHRRFHWIMWTKCFYGLNQLITRGRKLQHIISPHV